MGSGRDGLQQSVCEWEYIYDKKLCPLQIIVEPLWTHMGQAEVLVRCVPDFRSTVELLITDPPRSDHPLYNGQPLWNGLNLP